MNQFKPGDIVTYKNEGEWLVLARHLVRYTLYFVIDIEPSYTNVPYKDEYGNWHNNLRPCDDVLQDTEPMLVHRKELKLKQYETEE